MSINGYWDSIDVVPYSIDFDESERETDNGCYMVCSVSFNVPQQTPNRLTKLRALREERLALLIIDNSTGAVRLLGNRKEYLTHDRSFESGKRPSDLNSDRIVLSGQLKNGSVFYNGAVLIDPELTYDGVSFNLGGISKVEFCEQSNFLGYSNGDVYVVGGWHEVSVVPHSAEVNEKESSDEAGSMVETSLQFIVAQQTSELNHKLALLRERKLVFKITDNSTGLIKILGNHIDYLVSNRRATTGRHPSNRNEIQMQFEGYSEFGSQFFSGETTEPPLLIDGDGSFIVDKDLAFIGYE